MKDAAVDNTIKLNEDNLTVNLSIQKITALWSFSEAAFGGLLHALKIPFRGIFISSAAVVFISLIAFYSKQSKTILKSTMIVLLIKALVSPYTPLTAYFAVSLQGILGYIIFSSKRFFKISAMLLGIFSLTFSGAQKIIFLTILFGNTLWKSINVFIGEINQLFFSSQITNDINFGYLLISIYLLIHLIAGILIGIYAGKLPDKINSGLKNDKYLTPNDFYSDIFKSDQKKRKKWYQRPTGVMLFLLSFVLLIISYISPSEIGIEKNEIILMLLRSVILTIIWFLIISPIINRLFQKFVLSRNTVYTNEMNQIINHFPQFRKTLSFCWNNSSSYKGLKRICNFFTNSFYFLLLSEN